MLLVPLVVHWLLVTVEPLIFKPVVALIVPVALMSPVTLVLPVTSSLLPVPGIVPMPTFSELKLLPFVLHDHWLLVLGLRLTRTLPTALIAPVASGFPAPLR